VNSPNQVSNPFGFRFNFPERVRHYDVPSESNGDILQTTTFRRCQALADAIATPAMSGK
jgi:hypothetical protein